LLIMDGNMELPTMEYILDVCRSARVPGKKQFTQSFFSFEKRGTLVHYLENITIPLMII